MANYNLDVTLKITRDQFREKDPVEMAQCSGTIYDEEKKTFIVKFLNRDYLVKYPEGIVTRAEDKSDINISVEILILHYLINAKGVPLENKLISFKELPDGQIYIDPFNRRAIKPMLAAFGENPEALLRTAEKLNGKKTNIGDASVTIPVFPKVPITYVIWAGDDEFPPSGNILFDATAKYYLPTEDYALVSSLVVYELKKIAG